VCLICHIRSGKFWDGIWFVYVKSWRGPTHWWSQGSKSWGGLIPSGPHGCCAYGCTVHVHVYVLLLLFEMIYRHCHRFYSTQRSVIRCRHKSEKTWNKFRLESTAACRRSITFILVSSLSLKPHLYLPVCRLWFFCTSLQCPCNNQFSVTCTVSRRMRSLSSKLLLLTSYLFDGRMFAVQRANILTCAWFTTAAEMTWCCLKCLLLFISLFNVHSRHVFT